MWQMIYRGPLLIYSGTASVVGQSYTGPVLQTSPKLSPIFETVYVCEVRLIRLMIT